MLRRLLTAALLIAAGAAAAHLPGGGTPEVEALAPADVLGVYVVRLRGNGFTGNSEADVSRTERVRGRVRLTLSRLEDESNTRGLEVRIDLPPALEGTLIDKATPTPAFRGTGVLVGDSLTAIATGRSDFVNAVTMRFTRRGRIVSGWWLTSLADGAAVQSNFVTGVGSTFRGRRVTIAPAPLPAARSVSTADEPQQSAR